MPNINVDMSDDDYQYLMIHKALFRAYTWDAYVMKACLNWPMKAKVYGTSMSFSIPPPEHIDNKKVTFRMRDDTHEDANVVREKLGYTWREFLMYPSQHDMMEDLVTIWQSKSDGFQVGVMDDE